jgi:hypothetical protein
MKDNLKPKTIMLNDFELHVLEVLKNTYNLKTNAFMRRAIIEQAKREIPNLRIKLITDKQYKTPF